ncbi:MAG TPA: ABC transporter permease [Candidatus Limnocylindria bacterium]|jgi:NitT/TauT family transport system permease protein
MRRALALLRHNAPAIVVLVGGIALWEATIRGLSIRAFILPAPSSIARALGENWTAGYQILPAAQATLQEAGGGLIAGALLGLAVAFAVARYPSARDIVLPVGIAVNAIPIVAFAPLANQWFGSQSVYSKMAISAALVFFPIMINVLRGLTSVSASSVELMRSYAAGEMAVLVKLRVPNALPFFLTGLKIGTTLSLIGAVVGEYFGGLNVALGRVVVESASTLAFEVTWAAIVVVSAVGILMYLAVLAAERVLIPWHPSVRGERVA